MSKENEATVGLPLFSGAPMHDHFWRMAEQNLSVTMPPSTAPLDWVDGEPIKLPSTYEFDEQQRSVEGFITETDTAALLVIQNGKVRYERYELTGGRDVPWISFSVAKSFISALVGIALDEGLIGSLDDAISDYFDVAPGSAYDGVAIRDVLQMSSGARWNENYNDSESDIFRLSSALAGVGTFDEFVATSVAENEPGTVCRYNTADTQALTSLVVHATGRNIADYMHEKLLQPLGVVAPSHWWVDEAGRAAGGFGLNMTARDFARLGELYRLGGIWNGERLLSSDYVEASVNAAGIHTQLGEIKESSGEVMNLAYGYQWWLPSVDDGEFTALGVYNQLIYVHRPSASVIVKLSANRAYGTATGEATNRDVENTALLRGIARHIA